MTWSEILFVAKTTPMATAAENPSPSVALMLRLPPPAVAEVVAVSVASTVTSPVSARMASVAD